MDVDAASFVHFHALFYLLRGNGKAYAPPTSPTENSALEHECICVFLWFMG
jgi:hypothetical protein